MAVIELEYQAFEIISNGSEPLTIIRKILVCEAFQSSALGCEFNRSQASPHYQPGAFTAKLEAIAPDWLVAFMKALV